MKHFTVRSIFGPALTASLLATISGADASGTSGKQMFPTAIFELPGAAVVAVAAADLNGDAIQDLLAINADSNDLSVRLGSGGGELGSAMLHGVGSQPSGLDIGFFDADAFLDVAVANTGSDSVTILLGDGLGGFTAAATLAAGDEPRQVFTGEFTGDSHADLLVLGVASEDLRVLPGNGDGSFGAALVTPAAVARIAVADFDDNGTLDVAGINDVLEIFLGAGDGTFGAPAQVPHPGIPGEALLDVAVGDVNGNGTVDAVVASVVFTPFASNHLAFYGGQGDGSFLAAPVLSSIDAQSLQLVDVDGDDDLDIVTANASGPQGTGAGFVRLGDGTGAFGDATEFSGGVETSAVRVVDLDGDGLRDLVLANRTSQDVHVLQGRGDGFFGVELTAASAVIATDFEYTDVNGDGLRDLALLDAFPNTVVVQLSDGSGTFGAPMSQPVGDAAAFALGDVDGDQVVDVVAAVQGNIFLPGAVSVFSGQGNGQFGSPVTQQVAGNFTYLDADAADLDGDGLSDAVMTTSLGLQVLLSAGGGALSAPVDLAVGGAPTELAIADLDADGELDLVVTIGAAGHLALLFGNGDGTFSAPTLLAAGSLPREVAVEDLDLDGVLDLVVANAGAAQDASVFLGLGGGAFAPSLDVSGAAPVDKLAIADLDDDDVPDLVLAYDFIEWRRGNGDGTFGAGLVFFGGSNPFGIAAGDFDRDGLDDILQVNQAEGLGVLLNGRQRDPFCVTPSQLSLSAGGFQTFDIDAGPDRAGSFYIVLGSVTGTDPGIPFPPFHIPLNFDFYFSLTLTSPGGTFMASSIGFLDDEGEMDDAGFTIPAGTNPEFAGLTLHHAFAVFHPVTTFLEFVSNPVELEVMP